MFLQIITFKINLNEKEPENQLCFVPLAGAGL
jgi:hypothetical protein